MATRSTTFQTGHKEMIHDVQFDYYGKRVATASSDRTVKVFDVAGDKQTLLATLTGHDGPVWQVAWTHPKFGSIIASCGYDGRVLMWKETAAAQFTKIFEDNSHEGTGGVNSIAWAPHSFGLVLAAASADGTVTVFEHKENNTWERKSFVAHKGGCTAVSWGPDMKTGALLGGAGGVDQKGDAKAGEVKAQVVKRFVTAGCDNRVRIWRYNEQDGRWQEQNCFVNGDNAHQDWVRDAAWAPSMGLPSSTIATASEDKTVIIWTEDPNGMWRKSKVLKFDHKVWRVSWSVMGNILAVSQGDNKVTLWKESVDGEWRCLSDVQEAQEENKQNGL